MTESETMRREKISDLQRECISLARFIEKHGAPDTDARSFKRKISARMSYMRALMADVTEVL